jgi:hypothetical protein
MTYQSLRAGAALTDITPTTSQFLSGYPHIERMSTGVHDPLFSQALYISNGKREVMFIGNDVIGVPKHCIGGIRQRIADKTGVPVANILIASSHTHSGPILRKSIIARDDSVVPDPDAQYLEMMADRIVETGVAAHANAVPAKIGLARADVTGIGTNRHEPDGPANLTCPILAVKDAASDKLRAVMTVCAMHPTVMHEDSKLVSGDFPGLTRQYLADQLGDDVVFVYHMGTAGNQSPRHVTKSNTFDEAERLGRILGAAIERALDDVTYIDEASIACVNTLVDLPVRDFPSVDDAEAGLKQSIDTLEHLRTSGSPRQEVRTAECDWFGAERTLTLAQVKASGDIDRRAAQLSPAEVMLIRIGDWKFIGWPGEVFVEYGLQIVEADPDAFVITLAGGELEAYLVTQQAIDEKWYEANNAIFQSPQSPEALVEASKALLKQFG